MKATYSSISAVVRWLPGGMFVCTLLCGCCLFSSLRGQDTVGKSKVPQQVPTRALITVTWPGASAEEIEKNVAIPLEQAIASVAGLRTVRTSITKSNCQLIVTLTDRASGGGLKEIAAALATIRQLPEGAQEPQLRQVPAIILPVWVVWKPELETDVPTAMTVRKLSDRIVRLPGISKVASFGARQPYVEVAVDDASLRRSGISFEAVQESVDRLNVASQSVEKVPDTAEIGKLRIKVPNSTRNISLADLARIRSQSRYGSRVRWNGRASTALAIEVGATDLNTERSELEGRLRSSLLTWKKDLRLEGTWFPAFPSTGADIRVDIVLPVGTSRSMRDRIIGHASRQLAELLDGCSQLLIESERAAELHVGSVTDPDLLTPKIYAKLLSLPGVHSSVANLRAAPLPVVVRIIGPRPEALRLWSQKMARAASGLPGVSGIRVLGLETGSELQVVVKTEQAQRLGLDPATLGVRIRSLLANVVDQSTAADLPIVVRRATASVETADLSRMMLALPNGGQVPVSRVANLSLRNGLQRVIRVDQKRAFELQIQADSQASRQRIRQTLEPILSATRPPGLEAAFRFHLDKP